MRCDDEMVLRVYSGKGELLEEVHPTDDDTEARDALLALRHFGWTFPNEAEALKTLKRDPERREAALGLRKHA